MCHQVSHSVLEFSSIRGFLDVVIDGPAQISIRKLMFLQCFSKNVISIHCPGIKSLISSTRDSKSFLLIYSHDKHPRMFCEVGQAGQAGWGQRLLVWEEDRRCREVIFKGVTFSIRTERKLVWIRDKSKTRVCSRQRTSKARVGKWKLLIPVNLKRKGLPCNDPWESFSKKMIP